MLKVIKQQFSGGYILKAWAKLPNGTTIDYGASELGTGKTGAIYPTQITDANGNYVTITYRNNQGPNIETITDTLGRVVQFHYETQADGTELLTAVTSPGFNGGASRTLVRIVYDWLTLSNAGTNYGFASGLTTRVRKNTVPVVKAVYYPSLNTGYWFGDTDSYSPYGMIRKVSERRGMVFSGTSLTQQGTITNAGTMTRQMVYDNPGQPGYSYPHVYNSLSDTPTYTQMTEDWAARDTASAPVTYFSVTDDTGTQTRKVTVTRPDGVRSEQISDNNPNSSNYGLLVEDRTYPDASSQTPVHSSKVFWEHGAYNAPRPYRIEARDDRDQLTVTTHTYSAYYNAASDVREYGYGGSTLLQRTHKEYINTPTYNGSLVNSGTLWWHQGGYLYGGPQWQGPHIFNLVSLAEVYDSDDTTRVSRTVFEYDQQQGQSLVNTPNVPQHLAVADPYQPGEEYCDWVWNDQLQDYEYVCTFYPIYNPATDYRGNLTKTKRYANAITLDESTAVVETRGYDICGNARTLSSACCEQTKFDYTYNTRFTWPETTTKGSVSDTAQQNVSSIVYDLNTGLMTSSVDADGRTSVVNYHPTSLRPEFEYTPTGAYTYHIYDDAGLVVYDITYEAGKSGGDFAGRTDKYLDGHGRVHGEIAFGKDYVLDIVETKFDNLSRVWQQTRPYRYGETAYWYTHEYDKLDRETKVIAPDNTFTQNIYNESSYPSAATQGVPGQTVRSVDQWGRERWARFDERGRLVEVVEPDPNGSGTVASGGLLTKYTYNTLDKLTLVQQGVQTRSFKYDSLGRMTHQKLAERDATLNDNGDFVGSYDSARKRWTGGTWSDFISYDTRSNIVWRRDARGVKTTFNYGGGTPDPLNRLLSVQYNKDQVPTSLTASIPNAPNVSYDYKTSNDKTRIWHIYVDGGMGNETLDYDSEGRLSSRIQTFPGRESYPLETSCLYDSLNRVWRVTYPAQYGADGARKVVEQTYDIASRLQSLKYDGSNYLSNPVYNASSHAESLQIGGQVKEYFTYNPATGLLTEQKLRQGLSDTSPLLMHLSYNFTQNNDPNNNGAKTGQLTGITDNLSTTRNRAFVYDGIGRLKQVKGGANVFTGTPDWQQTYTFDRYGNRTSVTKTGVIALDAGNPAITSGSGSFTLNYNDPVDGVPLTNRITTTVGSNSYEHDPAGNQTFGQTDDQTWRQFRYDTAGRLAQVNDASGNLIESHSYGSGSLRLKTAYGTGYGVNDRYYAWESGAVAMEFTAGSGGSLVWDKTYVQAGGRLVATIKPATGSSYVTQYHHPDWLGTRTVTDSSGTKISEQLNLPYGTESLGESWTLPGAMVWGDNRRFTSYDRSSNTRLDYAVNRYYSPGQGRFTQADPLGINATSLSDPQTLNLYSYCGNDPINRTDPDGLFFGKLFKAIGKFFKAIGRFLGKVVKVALKILNNKWVGIGFMILGALTGAGLLGSVLKKLSFPMLTGKAAKVASTAVSIYNKVKNVVGYLSVASEVLQGRFKELGLGLIGSLPAILEDSVMQGIKDSFHNFKFSVSQFGQSVKDAFKRFGHGLAEGFKTGIKRLKIVITRDPLILLTPVYGFKCGAGYGQDTAGHDTINRYVDGVDEFDDAVCGTHDYQYVAKQNGWIKNKTLKQFDYEFFWKGLMAGTNGHFLSDRLMGVNIGLMNRFAATTYIGAQGVIRK